MTAGELYLFGMLHQAVLAGGAPALGNMRPIRGGSALVYPKVKGWCKLLHPPFCSSSLMLLPTPLCQLGSAESLTL
jgi:hypothetical protein